MSDLSGLLDSILPEWTYIRWHVGVTLRAVIPTSSQGSHNLRTFDRVLDRYRAAIVHSACGLVGLPERSCHISIGTTILIIAEFLLQSLIDCACIRFMALYDVEKQDAIVSIGGEARI